MRLWLLLGSLPPALCMAFVAGCRLRGHVPTWVTRAVFGLTAGFTMAVAYWTYLRLDQVATTLVVFGLMIVVGVLTASAPALVEDNAPPPAAMREQILAHHQSANLSYPRPPRGKRPFDIIV